MEEHEWDRRARRGGRNPRRVRVLSQPPPGSLPIATLRSRRLIPGSTSRAATVKRRITTPHQQPRRFAVSAACSVARPHSIARTGGPRSTSPPRIPEHRRPSAHWREAVNRTELCARIVAHSSLSRADAATGSAPLSRPSLTPLKEARPSTSPVRQVRHQSPRAAPGPQPSHRRSRFNPRPHRADFQGRQGSSRQDQRLEWRASGSGRIRTFRHPYQGRCAPRRPTRRDSPALICGHCLDDFDTTDVADTPTLDDRVQCAGRGRGHRLRTKSGCAPCATLVAGRRRGNSDDRSHARAPAPDMPDHVCCQHETHEMVGFVTHGAHTRGA